MSNENTIFKCFQKKKKTVVDFCMCTGDYLMFFSEDNFSRSL